MNELERLKKKLFKQESSELDEIYSFCAIMELVGGYEQLLNLPLTALPLIFKYMEFINKEQEKAYKPKRKW
jgi:hypothetical protein